jgi:hypothetical protein
VVREVTTEKKKGFGWKKKKVEHVKGGYRKKKELISKLQYSIPSRSSQIRLCFLDKY